MEISEPHGGEPTEHERLERTGLAKGKPQVSGEVLRYPFHGVGVVLGGRYGVEGVQEEVGIHLLLLLPQFVLLGAGLGQRRAAVRLTALRFLRP